MYVNDFFQKEKVFFLFKYSDFFLFKYSDFRLGSCFFRQNISGFEVFIEENVIFVYLFKVIRDIYGIEGRMENFVDNCFG